MTAAPASAADRWARLAAGFWLLLMVGALAVGALGSDELQRRAAHDGPGCPFRTATSLDCAFCGMTRATLALGRGELDAALAYHPVAPLVLALMFWLCGAIVIGRGASISRGRRPWVILGVIAAIWIVNLLG
ncbi:MAG: DUF2752 domain-containing protein [Kofleriaceae bacterium]|nr:DUF2752 domain-containing protein [Kofleriaceae bacterium]MBP9171354.1 DUF2752 domain-containing protein [Kofleriaceae bacterium]MBP9862831.1 DUF2752 domain-containing protein [Kofleriaceae bacterium]